MWTSRQFWQLFLAYTGLLLLAISACVIAISRWQEDQLVERVSRRLHDSAMLLGNELADPLAGGISETLQAKIRILGEQTATRFTLVASDGHVLADSEQATLADVRAMENHLNRKEFIEASRTGEGISQRLSPTLGVPFLYFALAIEENGKTVGYVRAAQPVNSIHKEVSAIQHLIWKVGLFVGLSGLAVSYWLTKRIVRPIQTLTNAAEAIAEGQYGLRINVPQGGELGTLARSFEHMSFELGTREQQLRENVQRHEAVLSGMIEGVIAVDSDSRILFANTAAGNLLRFHPNIVESRKLLEVVRSHDLHEIVDQTLNHKRLCGREMQWQGESLLTFDIHATPLPGDPCPGVVLVFHDITELKRLEGLRQQFVANVSHELKTPLSSIKAYTETLLNGAIGDQKNARRFLNRIDDQTNRLHDLILDMLSLARIESGAASLDLTDLSLNRIVENCITEYEPRAEASQLLIKEEMQDQEVRIRGDEEALQEILGNLLDNAIKFTPPGGHILVSCKKDASEAVLTVADTGVGIASEHHDRLFERFYRVDKARSRELGGTGLGLSIIKHLSQTMGGSVSVESQLGQGSTFQVRIPLAGA